MSILRKEINEILIKIKNGDEQSKNDLFEKTYNHLKIVAWPYVYNKDDVEDVLAEAYLRVFQYIDSFNPKKDGYNWICKIVQNVARDMGRKDQSVPLEEAEEIAYFVDFEDVLATKDEISRLLQVYPRRDREMVRRRFWGDKTIESIAFELNMGKSNVHKRILKITKEIEKKLENEVEKS